MGDIGDTSLPGSPRPGKSLRDSQDAPLRENLVLVIGDNPGLSGRTGLVCDYFGIKFEFVSSDSDLRSLLESRHPVAVVSPADTPVLDGCHVLKLVAGYDRNLPVLLLTGTDPIILGAVEAVEEIWQLGQVQKAATVPSAGVIAEFLSRAGRRSQGSLLAA